MQRRGAKSFVDDLVFSRGVVLSRAAASLRSIETKPFDWLICPLQTDTSADLSQSRKARPGQLCKQTTVIPLRGWPFIFFGKFSKSSSKIEKRKIVSTL